MGFDPAKKLTYWGDDPEWKKIEYDEELLAYEEMNRHVDGTYDPYDWGRTGRNNGGSVRRDHFFAFLTSLKKSLGAPH